MGLRPGGQDPVALLYFRHRPSSRAVLAELFLVAGARPVRPMTPARQAALGKALAARRRCVDCGEDGGYYLPAHRLCEGCEYTHGLFEPTDPRHDYLVGEPTLSGAEAAALAGVAPRPGRSVYPRPGGTSRQERARRAGVSRNQMTAETGGQQW
jgi:hypothetical protein